jgi:sRNA-binding carbon storage regulator CsrA
MVSTHFAKEWGMRKAIGIAPLIAVLGGCTVAGADGNTSRVDVEIPEDTIRDIAREEVAREIGNEFDDFRKDNSKHVLETDKEILELEVENQRLRSRVSELEGEVETLRRGARTD